ncbi:Rab3 GTPase-activating protein catalytic subunit [Geranomyces variabilis]|uniref:Rab3 GTPase-activating protein catalytic subunit n=1 Tax=Geranomyces variabilis TaxID=109894 RepID=A0AAD5XNE2_9FUNG|nr:Rab3 GTPase-activating protein catalytic subunit [Geranomyces variabilis]
MDDDIDEVFEIVDYTSASPFERFISNIESLLTEWELDAGGDSSAVRLAASEPAHLVLADAEYTLTCHFLNGLGGDGCAEETPPAFPVQKDYPSVGQAAHMLHRWTGLSRYLTLVPRQQSYGASLDLSKSKLLLSAFLIAAGNTECTTAAFVPTGPGWKSMWSGVRIDPDCGETRWRMVHAPYVPPQWSELEGLRRLIATKMEAEGGMDVSVAMSYFMPIDEEDIEWREHASSPRASSDAQDWTNEQSEAGDDRVSSNEDYGEVISLPYGPTANPLRSVALEALLPRQRVDTYCERIDFRDAPVWRLVCEAKEDRGDAILSSMLDRIVDAWLETQYGYGDEEITTLESADPVENSAEASTNRRDTGGTVDAVDIADALQALLEYPSSPPPSTPPPAAGKPTRSSSSQPPRPLPKALATQYRAPHLFPPASLLDALTLRVLDWQSPEAPLRFREASLHHTLGALWADLVAELRVCWATGMDIPGVWPEAHGNESIGLRWSLLHQKLQMLSHCIKLRRERGEQDVVPIVEKTQPSPVVETPPSPAPPQTSMLSLGQRVFSTVSELKPDGFQSLLTSMILPDRRTPSPIPQVQQQPAPPPPLPPPRPPARSPLDRPPLEATSWSSDRSWEDVKARRGSVGQLVVGSLENRSFRSMSSFGDLAAPSSAGSPNSPASADALASHAPTSHPPRHDHDHHPHHLANLHEDDDIFFDSMEDVPEQRSQPLPAPPTATTTRAVPPPPPVRVPSLTDSFIHLPAPQSPPAPGAHSGPTPITERRGQATQLPFPSHANPDSVLYTPHTLAPPPQTEDTAVAFELRLQNMHPTLRAREQSSGLRSDMMAFKAANPGCGIEDFVRWWSPRDWIEDEDGKGGALSARMKEPGNLWVEMWEAAPAVPAVDQPPLFDHSREASNVLDWLERLSLNQLIAFLVPQAFLHTYRTLATHPYLTHIPLLSTLVARFATSILSLGDTATSPLAPPLPPAHPPTHTTHTPSSPVLDAVKALQTLEAAIGAVTALRRLFTGGAGAEWALLRRVVDRWWDGDAVRPAVAVVVGEDDGVARNEIVRMFRRGGARAFPLPVSREYVFKPSADRTKASQSDDSGSSGVERVYAMLKGGEFRIVETARSGAA